LADTSGWWCTVPNRPVREDRRVIVEPDGPVLVEGPVQVVLPDGSTATSERATVAVCTCRRSRIYPWCDTSHRDRGRSEPDPE
jgi:hypothetical protein